MNLNRHIPDFFVKRRNTVIQIIFTAIFAYAFILVYHPFGSQSWFEINTGQFAFYTGAVVVLGMAVVIISRVIMTQIRKVRAITIAGYALMVALEVLAMTGFYMMIQKVFLKDQRFWFEVYYTAIFNTTLILLIPYLISLLYFAWLDKKLKFEKLMVAKKKDPAVQFVNFDDENGETRLSVLLSDLLYLEASENYVTIHFLVHGQPDRMLLRTSMKKMEEQLSAFPVYRCHRSYMVNLGRISIARKERSGLVLQLNSPVKMQVPVSESYRNFVQEKLKKI